MFTNGDIELFCGHGEKSFTIWNSTSNDFGVCFEKFAFSCLPHAFLAAGSAYHFASHYSKRLTGPILYSPTLHFRLASTIVAILLCIGALLTAFLCITFDVGLVDAVDYGFRLIAWSIQSGFTWRLHRYRHLHLRGPKFTLCSFVLTAASSIVLLQSAVRCQVRELRALPNFSEFFIYGFCFLYTLYLLTLIPHRRPPLVPGFLHTQEESQDFIINSNHVSLQVDQFLGNAADQAGFLSKIVFSWVGPMMTRGSKGHISSVDDVFNLPSYLCTDIIDDQFHHSIYTSDRDAETKTVVSDHQAPQSSDNTVYNESADMPTERTLQKNASLLTALRQTLGAEYLLAGILKLLSDTMSFAGPILLNFLLNFMTDPSQPMWHGYAYTGALFLSTLLCALFSTHFGYRVSVVGLKVRAAVISAVYRKTLVISTGDFNSSSSSDCTFSGSGEVVNLMSTDVDRVVNFCPSFHQLWSLPLQVAVALYLLYMQVGISFLAGVAFAVLLIPINRFIAVKIADLSQSLMSQKDSRVKMLNEVMFGIRAIKLNAWEPLFAQRVTVLRGREVESLSARKYLDALCVFFWATTPVLISILTFMTFVLLGNQLTAAKVFTSIALFGILIVPLNAFPWVINGMMEAWVSLGRLQKYLGLNEVDWKCYYTTWRNSDDEVIIEDGSFSWQLQRDAADISICSPDTVSVTDYADDEGDLSDSDRNELLRDRTMSRRVAITRGIDAVSSDHVTLKSINLTIAKGSLVGIVGRVGSGKSAILSAIAAEMCRTTGRVIIDGHVLEHGFGLVTQDAWTQHATLRDNVLFGRLFDRRKYDLVLDACALVEDIKVLPAGDQTEIGENGVTLSGGQKARVSLARAVYQEKTVYLLDDPLAAVDVHVASHLFKECIMGYLADTTRVLVTHHTHYLRDADVVIVVDRGRIVQTGPPSVVLNNLDLPSRPNSSVSEGADTGDGDELAVLPSANVPDVTDESGVLVTEEEKETGVVKGYVYWSYWLAVGRCLAASVLVSIFFMQASRNVADWWLSYWISHAGNGSHSESHNVTLFRDSNTFLLASLPDSRYQAVALHLMPWQKVIWTNIADGGNSTDIDDFKFYLTVYAILAGANSFFTLIRSFLFAYGGIEAAIILHRRLLNSVLKAPVRFFDGTPIGRIINRFSSDIYCVDDSLPFILNIFLAQAYGVVGIVVICCYGLPYFALVIAPLAVIYYFIQRYYRHTSRELKRIGSVTLSPIYAHFSETVTGLATIRALRQMERFRRENRDHLECNQRAQFAGIAASQWLSLRLQLIGVAMVTAVAVIAIIEHSYQSINASLVGLAISYVLSVTGLLNGVVTYFTETEKQMVSVERVNQYINDIPQESQAFLIHPPTQWPSKGCISFRHVCLRYRAGLPLALNEVTFETSPGEKIGIVGRTGAGKSSLFLTLFRLVDIESGTVCIDDIDIYHVSLHDLRSRLAIIPQDPFLFSGSVRDNIDPDGTRSADQINDAIERCHLRSTVDKLGGLDGEVTERGRSLSNGERQLVCLARALLSRAQVLCIDEATASIDHETDTAIQLTLRQQFAGRTVLTVAHRLSTVIDNSDRVMVMDVGGRLAEFASPAVLLSNRNSLFYALVNGADS